MRSIRRRVSFTSQNMGAGKHERINRILLCGEICALIVGVVMGNACVIFGNSLLGVYSSSPEVIQAGLVRLKVVAATYALCGMMDVMVGSLRESVIPLCRWLFRRLGPAAFGFCGWRRFSRYPNFTGCRWCIIRTRLHGLLL